MSDSAPINLTRLTIRWIFLLGALFVLGPVAGGLIGSLRDSTGGHAATPLTSSEPVTGILSILFAFTLAALVGAGGGRIFGPRLGMRCAGLVLAWAAWSTGTIDAIIRSAQSAAPLRALALEAVVVSIAMLALLGFILFLSRPRAAHEEHDLPCSGALLNQCRRLASPASLIAVVAGFVGGGLVAWVVAISPLKGQAVFSAIAAGIGAGAIARLTGSSIEDDPCPLAPYLSIVLLAIGAPVAGIIVHGSGIVDAVYAGEVFAATRVLPLDVIAGGVLGVPIGLAWACSMMEKQHPAPKPA